MGQPTDLGPKLGNDPLAVLRHVLSDPPPGWGLEFGVASGRTLRMIAERMNVVGWDSFAGLPEDWRPGFSAGMFACSVPDVPSATLVPGLFADTLPGWTPPGPIGLVHIDCDLYSSTVTVLDHIGPHLRPGTVIVFDEWHNYPGCEDHEQRAWTEYSDRTETTWTPVGHGPEQLAIRLTS